MRLGDVSIAASGWLVLRTHPFVVLRLAVYLGVAAAFAVAAVGGSGIGLGLGTLTGVTGRAPGAFWGAVAGFAFVALLLWWLREYFLYFVEIGHATALSAALDQPSYSASGQVASVMTAVQRRFREAGALFAAERRVRGTVVDLTKAQNHLAAWMPPGINLPRDATETALRLSLGFVSKAMLAQAIGGRARDPYANLQASLTLLAQHHDVLLRNAILIAALSHAASAALFLLSLIPAAIVVRSLPGGGALVAVFLAMAFAWAIRRALIEPFAIAAFLELCRRVWSNDSPDPDWEARLTAISDPYREIKAMAAPPARGTRRGVMA